MAATYDEFKVKDIGPCPPAPAATCPDPASPEARDVWYKERVAYSTWIKENRRNHLIKARKELGEKLAAQEAPASADIALLILLTVELEGRTVNPFGNLGDMFGGLF